MTPLARRKQRIERMVAILEKSIDWEMGNADDFSRENGRLLLECYSALEMIEMQMDEAPFEPGADA